MAFIRTELEDDIHHIHAIHREAFGRAAEGDLVNALRHTNYFSPDLSLVAAVGDEQVGHILFTRIVIKDGSRTYPVLALAPVAVKPSFQKQGIGTELITEGLRLAKYAGHKAIIVLGDPKFYGRFGFERASKYDIIPPAGMPEEAFLIAKLGPEDSTIRGQVYYPVEFNAV
ncbi:MAG: GNAT family N-acetyltransferase [Cellulosilyticaceae bacterium]